MKREHWKSRLGFIWSAVGSAVGLGSIWRFPYIVGQNGGAAFVLLFVFFLFFISLPVLIAEIAIGRKMQLNPHGSFRGLGRNRFWSASGSMTIVTGFIVSSFYSIIAGWTLGYLIEALAGNLTQFSTVTEAASYFQNLSSSPYWALGCHLGFILISIIILYVGVRRGIESGNKVMMPLLFVILLLLVFKGLSMNGASKGLAFLFSPDWSSLTPTAIMMALGQAFFGLSLGQGTMVTYGSYLSSKESIPNTSWPIACSVTIVSLLAGIAIFTVVFSVGATPESGTNLMFETLPVIFSGLKGGQFLAILFFSLIFIAGLTSQISAMEPLIAYLTDEKRFNRHGAVWLCGIGSFLLGIPSALSFGVFKSFTIMGSNFFDAISFLSVNILVPLGGLAALLLVGWRWGLKEAFSHLSEGAGKFFRTSKWLQNYLGFSIKYLIPLVIIFILLNTIGVFK